jgi:hypothetical protein
MAASIEKAESQRLRVRERMMELQAQLAATQVCDRQRMCFLGRMTARSSLQSAMERGTSHGCHSL